MTRLLLALVCTLTFAGMSLAEYAVGYSEDGYSYAGEGLWAKGDTYYTRTYREYAGQQPYYSYGYTYYRPVTYWYYQYTPQLSPQSTDADWIAWGRERERNAAKAALKDSDQKNFIERLTKFGITPPPPGIADYGGSAFSFRQAYVPPLQGATAYGYTVRQEADLYAPFNVDAALLTLGQLGKNSLEVSREISGGINGAVTQQLAANERIALAREDTKRVIETIRESRPPSRITTTVTGTGSAPVQPPAFPAIPPKEVDPRVSVASNQCLSCHSGASPSGKLDMSKPPSEEQVRKMAYRMSLPLTDKGHMPAAAEGKPGKQLTVEEMVNVMNEAAKASAPKP